MEKTIFYAKTAPQFESPFTQRENILISQRAEQKRFRGIDVVIKKDDEGYYYYLKSNPDVKWIVFTRFYDLLDFYELLNIKHTTIVGGNRAIEILERNKSLEKLIHYLLYDIYKTPTIANANSKILSYILEHEGLTLTISRAINGLASDSIYSRKSKNLTNISTYHGGKPFKLNNQQIENINLLLKYKHFDTTDEKIFNVLKVSLESLCFAIIYVLDDKREVILQSVVKRMIEFDTKIAFQMLKNALPKSENIELIKSLSKVTKYSEKKDGTAKAFSESVVDTLFEHRDNLEKVKVILENVSVNTDIDKSYAYPKIMSMSLQINSPYVAKYLLSKSDIGKYVDMEFFYKEADKLKRHEIMDMIYEYLDKNYPSLKRNFIQSFKTFFR